MMRKLCLNATAVFLLSGLGVANAAEVYNKDGNKLDLYGKIQAMHYFSDDSANDGDKTYIRFGFKGQTQINDLLTGYGQWEYHMQGNNSEGADATNNTKTRLGFAGIKAGKYGSFDYGRNYGAVYDVLAVTDLMPEFGGPNGTTDTFLRQRATGLATYRNSGFFGLAENLKFALQYQGKNDRTSINKANGDGWATSVQYDTDADISLMAAYSNSDRTNAQNSAGVYGKGDRAENWAVGMKYDDSKWYFATIYGDTRNSYYFTDKNTSLSGFANKADYFEATLQYQFINGLRPSLLYVQTKAKDVEGVGKADLIKFVEPGVAYYFNKNMRMFFVYKVNLMSDDNNIGASSDDVAAAGLVYQF